MGGGEAMGGGEGAVRRRAEDIPNIRLASRCPLILSHMEASHYIT